MSFIIAGFADAEHYEVDDSNWDGSDVYENRDDAESAAKEWISAQPENAYAELIELSPDGTQGLVRRVLMGDTYEDILYPGNSDPW